MSGLTQTQPLAATKQEYLSDTTRWHPPGVFLLCFTEMWERMSYYGMRAILVLYLVDKTHGGLGWDKTDALALYGTYTGLVYVTPIFGGLIADNFIGQRRAVLFGGTLMMIGHFLMAVQSMAAFYAALGFLILGNGFFKPNISTMVGGLYRPGDGRRDSAFTFFYMGINAGAFLAPLICGTLGENAKYGWHWGFAAAGVGMGLSLVAFLIFNRRWLGSVGLAPKAAAKVATAPAPFERKDIDRIIVILVLAVFVIFFWMAFEQAGGLMNLYTDSKVNRMVGSFEMPTSWFQAFNAAFIVMFGPLMSMLWAALRRMGKEPSIPVKMAFGLFFVGAGFVLMMGASKQADADAAHKANMMWVIGAYWLHTIGELCLSPVGLSMVTKLAHQRIMSLMMGVWFLSNAAANKLSGLVGGLSDSHGEYQVFFGLVVATAVAGVVLLGLSIPLKKMMHGADKVEAEPVAAPSLPGGAQATTA